MEVGEGPFDDLGIAQHHCYSLRPSAYLIADGVVLCKMLPRQTHGPSGTCHALQEQCDVLKRLRLLAILFACPFWLKTLFQLPSWRFNFLFLHSNSQI